jgi:hypothetical protein
VAGGSNGDVNDFNAIEDRGEVKRGIKGGGNDGGVSNGSDDIREWSWAAWGSQRRRGETARSAGVGKGMELTGRPHMAVT